MTCNLYQRSGLYVPGRSTNKPQTCQTCQRKTSKKNHGVDQCSRPVQRICHDSGSFEGFSTWNPIPDRGQLPVSFHHLAAGEASLHMVPKMVWAYNPYNLRCRHLPVVSPVFSENFQVPTPLEPIFGSLAGLKKRRSCVPVTFPFLPLDIFETGIEIIVNTFSGKVVLRTKNRWLADRTAGWGWLVERLIEAWKGKNNLQELEIFPSASSGVSTETRVKKTHIAPTHTHTHTHTYIHE